MAAQEAEPAASSQCRLRERRSCSSTGQPHAAGQQRCGGLRAVQLLRLPWLRAVLLLVGSGLLLKVRAAAAMGTSEPAAQSGLASTLSKGLAPARQLVTKQDEDNAWFWALKEWEKRASAWKEKVGAATMRRAGWRSNRSCVASSKAAHSVCAPLALYAGFNSPPLSGLLRTHA